VAYLRSVLRRNKLNLYPIPSRFIDSIFNNFASHPIADSSIELSGITLNGIQFFEILHRYHCIVFFGDFNNLFADIMGNPIVYSFYLSPQSLDSLACSLSFWKHGFKLIYAMPERSDFMHELPVFQKFNISDFPILVKQGYNRIIPQTQIYSNNTIIALPDFNLFLYRNNKVKLFILSDQLKSTDFILAIQSILKQLLLCFSTLDRNSNPLTSINLYLKEEVKLFTLLQICSRHEGN